MDFSVDVELKGIQGTLSRKAMSWRVSEQGRVARMRRSYGDASFEKEDLGEVAVEIVSAELAQDGGPAPDVRCTIAQRSSGGISPRVVSTSICRQAWSPVWKEMLRLELDSSTRMFDLVLWDESAQAEGGEPSCLGELVSFPCFYRLQA